MRIDDPTSRIAWNGERRHRPPPPLPRGQRVVVRGILGSVGLDETALRCPVAWPGDRAARGGASAPSRIAMNCSGKHAAFLAACAREGWSLEDYLEPAHPLQQRIRSTVAELTGTPPVHWSLDGEGRANTAVIERTGVVAKLGAEGVLVLLTREGAADAAAATTERVTGGERIVGGLRLAL